MRYILSGALACGFLVLTGVVAKADGQCGSSSRANVYEQDNLVSDIPGLAAHTDANLVNPWGIAFSPNGPDWVANNGTGVSTLYDGDGNSVSPPGVVTIPAPPGSTGHSTPNGITFNSAQAFFVKNDKGSSASAFLFSTEDGTIAGWDPSLDLFNAILAVDHSCDGTVYKGLALAGDGTELHLYAADFFHGKVDVFNSRFDDVTTSFPFVDPDLPAGFAPFGIRNILGDIFVTFALQDDAKHDNVAGAGLGFVDVFTPDGKLVRRFASRGRLNAPWGLSLAPQSFGKFGGRLLVGNFGDGRINAFDFADGDFKGTLRAKGDGPLTIDGLWGLAFGNGMLDQPASALFFAAGINGEADGLYGRIEAVSRQDDEDDVE
jgi:uncharacterized protein (TIGR03118 family)